MGSNADKRLERENFFSQEKEFIELDIKDNTKLNFYKLKRTGQVICEVNLNLGLGGERVEIAQITDVHLNYCLSDEQEDEEVLYTKQCRTWLADGESVGAIIKAMDVAQYFDQTIITGDILDYLSMGAAKLTKENIFDRDPQVICTIGGHDITKQMETGIPNKLPIEERFKIVQNFWIHDIFYHSKVVKDKIMVIGLNTSVGSYYPQQIDCLKRDIKRAREEKKCILIFQHEPISTGRPQDISVEPVIKASANPANTKPRNFYSGCIGNPASDNPNNKEMYHIITHSADVIKGVFCGHYHSAFYTEIKAFLPNEKETVIPQYLALGNPYFGQVGAVTRIKID